MATFLVLHSIRLYVGIVSRITMQPEYPNLGSRFKEIKEAYAEAKTVEEKQELLALAGRSSGKRRNRQND